MSILNDDQARLLAAYSDALALDRDAPLPNDLDPEFAALARHLAVHTAPEPTASTLADIRARLLTPQTPATTHNGQYTGTWSATPLRLPAQPAPPPARLMERAATYAGYAAPAPAPPISPQQPTAAPPIIAQAAPAITPARRPSLPTRLAGALLGTLVALGAIGVLIVSLGIFRPSMGPGTAPSATPSAPAVVCGTAPTAVRPTPTPGISPSVSLTATAASQLAATVAAQPPVTPTLPGPRLDNCTRPRVDMLTLDQAAAIVRALIGQPDAELYAYYRAAADPSQDTIVIQHPFPVESGLPFNRDFFEIDAATGTLVGASWVSHESSSLPQEAIDENEALARAEAFARTQYPDLDTLQQRRVRSNGGTFPNTEVLWQLRSGDTGTWLPTTITTTVSLRTGLVISYMRYERPYTGPTNPLISEADAQAHVLAVAHQDPRYTGLQVTETTLWVAAPQQMNNTNTDYRLLWTITLANPPQGALGERIMLTWYVDALTGEVIAAKGGG